MLNLSISYSHILKFNLWTLLTPVRWLFVCREIKEKGGQWVYPDLRGFLEPKEIKWVTRPCSSSHPDKEFPHKNPFLDLAVRCSIHAVVLLPHLYTKRCSAFFTRRYFPSFWIIYVLVCQIIRFLKDEISAYGHFNVCCPFIRNILAI